MMKILFSFSSFIFMQDDEGNPILFGDDESPVNHEVTLLLNTSISFFLYQIPFILNYFILSGYNIYFFSIRTIFVKLFHYFESITYSTIIPLFCFKFDTYFYTSTSAVYFLKTSFSGYQ